MRKYCRRKHLIKREIFLIFIICIDVQIVQIWTSLQGNKNQSRRRNTLQQLIFYMLRLRKYWKKTNWNKIFVEEQTIYSLFNFPLFLKDSLYTWFDWSFRFFFFNITVDADKLFSNYLINRRYIVKIHNNTCESIPIKQGVPQGLVLRPLLFSIHTTFLKNIVKFCSIHC